MTGLVRFLVLCLLAGFTDFVKGMAEAASRMGNVSPEQIVRAALKLDLLGAEDGKGSGT